MLNHQLPGFCYHWVNAPTFYSQLFYCQGSIKRNVGLNLDYFLKYHLRDNLGYLGYGEWIAYPLPQPDQRVM